MTRPEISGISPFFIVRDTAASLSFYRDQLGFEITFQEPTDDPFFGIVCRGGAMIMLKAVGVDPIPNYKREPAARWDAYVHVPDPDALASEFASRNVAFSETLKDTHDGLRGFELKTPMATSCSSVVLGHEYRWRYARCPASVSSPAGPDHLWEYHEFCCRCLEATHGIPVTDIISVGAVT